MSDKEFPKKYKNKLTEEWQSNVQSMENDDLNKQILLAEGNVYAVEKAKEEDVELNAQKEQIKGLMEPYRETKASETAKIKFCLWLLESRGVDFDKREK